MLADKLEGIVRVYEDTGHTLVEMPFFMREAVKILRTRAGSEGEK